MNWLLPLTSFLDILSTKFGKVSFSFLELLPCNRFFQLLFHLAISGLIYERNLKRANYKE